eukprot:757269-Hanusia_phi.AAC.7
MATVSGWGASRVGMSWHALPCRIQSSWKHITLQQCFQSTCFTALTCCQACNLFGHSERRPFVAKTVDVGGASPVSMLLQATFMNVGTLANLVELQAKHMVENEGYSTVAIVGGDAVSSLPSKEFLNRADDAFAPKEVREKISFLNSPYIPNAYAHCSAAHMQTYAVTREQLAMVPVLMSAQAMYHPRAIQRLPYSLNDILTSAEIGPNLNLLECARKADGAAAILVSKNGKIKVEGGAEASGPVLVEQDYNSTISRISSARHAFQKAVWTDCLSQSKRLPVKEFPVNTHGGLLSFGAPWEVPAFFSLIEAFEQLSSTATEGQSHSSEGYSRTESMISGGRQIPNCHRAIVYGFHRVQLSALTFPAGNGGVFNSSAVVILSSGHSH